MVEPLNEVQRICQNYECQSALFLTNSKHVSYCYGYRQREKDGIHRYLKIFKLMVENIQLYGGTIGRYPGFIKDCMIQDGSLKKDATSRDFLKAFSFLSLLKKEEYGKQAKEITLATAFLMESRPLK